ncbi:MAG: hypothetical protein UT30_C0001G0006 [Candidatus Uhrbacteria bacterium GW2011_GWF2_39_13]|uniref:Cell division protein FtsL n=1 Tax=Candidatus Uhrbacteria bacterium GW2011_GWF2_39_13 TaxID=1618995 RepID=A0A0G0QTV2_9BACT|nr:MAG: hypothetical protein UT30_C0001G0006 [Candidatus Uhrbacteria bacterium GW2011_GWF2_39_13]HAU65953.1 hypothetical protein [Candidatus Uhrbacteria bacterium]
MTFPVASQSIPLSQSSFERFSFRTWVHSHVVALNIISLIFILFLVIGYIIQVNASISKGYQIRDLETRVNQLSVLNEKIEIESRKAQSLDHVASSVKMLGFVKAEKLQYLNLSDTSYAFAE